MRYIPPAIQHCTALALYCSVICLEKRIRRRSGGDLLGGDMLLAEVQVWEEGHGLDVEEDAEDAEEDHSPAGNDHTEMEFFTLFRKEMFLKMVYTQIAFFRGIMNPAHLKRFLSKIFNFSSDSKDYIVFISNYWYLCHRFYQLASEFKKKTRENKGDSPKSRHLWTAEGTQLDHCELKMRKLSGNGEGKERIVRNHHRPRPANEKSRTKAIIHRELASKGK